MTIPKPAVVIHTMRMMARTQVRLSYMDRDALAFITDNELVQQINWPSTFIRITDAGAQYIAENGEPE